MKKVIINAWTGWNNSGDEAILQAILQSFKPLELDITIGTSIPYTFFERHSSIIKYPVISQDTTILEYDIHLFGLGGLGYNLPWKQILNAKSKNKKLMIYGGGMEVIDLKFTQNIKNALSEMYKLFDIITVRSLKSKEVLDDFGIESILTMDPAINLESEKWDCPENYVVVCPRFPDYGHVNGVIDYFIESLKSIKDEVILLPFGPYNLENHLTDLYVCNKIKETLNIPIYNFHPITDIKKVKYLISKSKKVITNGRYHALLFAIAENTEYELTDNQIEKNNTLIEIHKQFNAEELKNMERKNFELFKTLL